MLYAIAAVKGIEALAMMTVSDILGATEDERERITDEQLREGRRRHDRRRMPSGDRLTGRDGRAILRIRAVT